MWNVRRRGRERGLSSLLAGCSLTCGDFQKGLEEKFLRGRWNQCALRLIGQCVAESLGRGIDLREKVDM